jgi:hypothetical protein
MNKEDAKYRNALERVRRIRGFYVHLGIYALVNSLLFLINIVTTPGVLWFYWPLFGWGLGVALHALIVFGLGSVFGPDWEEKKMKEFMDEAN